MEAINSTNSIFSKQNLNKWIQSESYYIHFYNNFDMVVHSHNRIEIIYVVLGQLTVEYQVEDRTESILVYPNSYVFIDADVPHKICVNNVSTKLYNVEFRITTTKENSFSFFNLVNKNDLMKKFLYSNQRVFKIADDGLFLQNLLLIQKYLGDTPDMPCDDYLSHQYSALMLVLAKQVNYQRNTSYGVRYINKALTYIYDHYNDDITLKGIAEYCEISQNYLNNIFVKTLNLTVNNFINKYRVQRAMLLLESSEMSIEDIYEQVGYHNKMNFHKNFMKFLGVTPLKYRKLARNLNIIKNSSNPSPNMYFLI